MPIQQMFLGAGSEFIADPGQQTYTSPGSYSWTCPEGVFSVSVVCVGTGGISQPGAGAGGGGGGGLGYKNNISVTAGQSYTVVVGARGTSTYGYGNTATVSGDTYFINTSTVKGGGGGARTFANASADLGGGYTGDGGGNGGNGGLSPGSNAGGGGGGAGGYSGDGGDGGSNSAGSAGSGGGGGGGGSNGGGNQRSGGGGGVGILGSGSNGTAGPKVNSSSANGGGGSGGVACSRRAAEYGAKVALIEGDRLGGTCVIRGCIPKKLMMYAGEIGKTLSIASSFGWTNLPTHAIQHDLGKWTKRKNFEIDRLEKIYEKREHHHIYQIMSHVILVNNVTYLQQ